MFDEKCYDLAEYFLPSMASEKLKRGLAEAIQTAVEDFFSQEEVAIEAMADPHPIPSCPRCDNKHWPHCGAAVVTYCDDCPPVGYPTDKTRCEPCPRRAQQRSEKP